MGEIAKFKVLCPDDNKTYVDVNIDLTKVVELQDDTALSDSVACGGGACEIV